MHCLWRQAVADHHAGFRKLVCVLEAVDARYDPQAIPYPGHELEGIRVPQMSAPLPWTMTGISSTDVLPNAALPIRPVLPTSVLAHTEGSRLNLQHGRRSAASCRGS